MKTFIRSVNKLIATYPAIIASYFIYGYYFISTMEFYIAFKKKHFGASEALSHFDTLLWMWMLAFVLVKIIELREKLHGHEHANTEHQHTIQLKETQIKTLHEVILTLEHEINNPLAIIFGYVRLIKKETTKEKSLNNIAKIEEAAQRITHVLKEFSTKKTYEVTPSPVGNLVTVDEKKIKSTTNDKS